MNLQKNKTTRDPARAINNLSYPLPRNRSGAMEMSVGTIVTIVLLMSVLVLGIFLVQKIFKTGTSAIDQVGTQIDSEISKLFAEEGASIIIYPSSRDITLKKGDDPKGFAFAVKNEDGVQMQKYTFKVEARGESDSSSITGCGSLTKAQADNFVLGGSGNFELGGGILSNSKLVRFSVPKTAPSCSLFYDVKTTGDQGQTSDDSIFVTIK